MDDPNKGKVVAVVGLGSAGIQTICHLLSFLKYGSVVVSIHDPDTPSLGIGESTNPSFTGTLERGLDFNISRDIDRLDATYKLCTKYEKWREHDFENPLINGGVAIHFNTNKLKDFALPRLKEKWGDKFEIIKGKVTSIYNLNDYTVGVQVGDDFFHFDYVIDCRGFPEEYVDYNVLEETVNHCLVHNINEGANWMHTKHTATQDGWMFGVPLQSRTSYGYLFNDKITDVNLAKENFSKLINVDKQDLDSIEYKFKSYYAKELIDGNIIKNGNRALFFEPMFANSLFLYNVISRLTLDFIYDYTDRNTINKYFLDYAKGVEDMIAYHYHGGSTYETEFWNTVSKKSKEKLEKSEIFNFVKNETAVQANLKRYESDDTPSWVFGSWALQLIDNNFGYNYFVNDNGEHFVRNYWI